jgi:hypothetical protein
MCPVSKRTSVSAEILVQMQVGVLWVVAPCSDMVRYQRFRRTCCLHTHPEKRSSETSVSCHITIRRHNIEDYDFNLHCSEEFNSNLSSINMLKECEARSFFGVGAYWSQSSLLSFDLATASRHALGPIQSPIQ